MKTKYHPKFLFSQLSGAFVGITWTMGSSLLLLIFLKPYLPMYAKLEMLYVFIFIIILIANWSLSVFIWAKVLVFFNIITKEEAQGYPYSKPWERKHTNKYLSS